MTPQAQSSFAGSESAGLDDVVLSIVREALRKTSRRPIVIGISGAQGSGKSTLARKVEFACHDAGIRSAVLSLDDLYLTRIERQWLARTVHPLLSTRGVPGTHDVELGMRIIAALENGLAEPLVRFDKAVDDRRRRDTWPAAPAHCEVLIFEGWCVGAIPQPPQALDAPINQLEATEDIDGIWRTFANDALTGSYRELFDRIDSLIMLAAPDFEIVASWRREQEQQLAAKVARASGLMSDVQLSRFLAHYERLTRFMLQEMPARADCVVKLDAARNPVSIRAR